ncbi:MAG TPA: nuclear transport factor 2 family protein [Rhodanobacteraceae bacterium]|nr:nuclear transport factor 2 family protein [Rhodanobacteraceae bacterium]
MKIEQDPVTGREPLAALNPQMRALSGFYRALNDRDLDLMSRIWAQSDDVAMDNPVGGIKRGWNEIRAVYMQIFSRPEPFWFEFHDYSFHAAADVFYVVGREHGEYRSGPATLRMAIRTSRLFRLVDGEWKQVHHHGSIDDPTLLAQYQAAVRGNPRLLAATT